MEARESVTVLMALSRTVKAAIEPAAVDKSTPPEELRTEALKPTFWPVAVAPTEPPTTIPRSPLVDIVMVDVVVAAAAVVATAVVLVPAAKPESPTAVPPNSTLTALPFAAVKLIVPSVPEATAVTPV